MAKVRRVHRQRTSPRRRLKPHLPTGVLFRASALFVALERELGKEVEVSEAEYSYLASLLRKAQKDTQEDETAQEEALILAEQIALLRKESRRAATESG